MRLLSKAWRLDSTRPRNRLRITHKIQTKKQKPTPSQKSQPRLIIFIAYEELLPIPLAVAAIPARTKTLRVAGVDASLHDRFDGDLSHMILLKRSSTRKGERLTDASEHSFPLSATNPGLP
ncbi:uncharacterized protein DS421_5g160670 [Arachis hypogaea]|nr:uncharacterized protein DS421_5g160670 [Arachis hypogaea]